MPVLQLPELDNPALNNLAESFNLLGRITRGAKGVANLFGRKLGQQFS
jgi:hypothetical protein